MDEILNLIESVSEGFPSYFCPTLPHLLNNKYCHYVKEEQYLNLNVYLKSYEENYLNGDY